MKGPLEVSLTTAAPPRYGRGWWSDDDYVYDGDVGVLRIGRTLAVLDTTFSESDDVTKRWLAEALTESRGRRLRAPLVVGLVALRGHDPATTYCYWRSDPGFKPNDTTNPIRCVALCLGGSRALVYCPDAHGYRVGRPDRDDGRLKFTDNMKQLRAFLDDKRITVACFGAGEAAKKLAKEWGLHVACPTELTDLFVRAYGKAAGLDEGKDMAKRSLPAKYWMGKAALARERAKAERDGYDTDDYDKDGTDPWKRAEKMVRGLSLERMGRVAIGREMRLARWPAKVAEADWGGRYYHVGEQEWAYATRDAFLCFEIAAHCLQKLGVPTGP